ncbi:hypothetical protein EJ02DRAFT_468714 [Clathrospora elynae]|uniref:Uncharacterized protein n=1 Tax=Clathrospora elynae TaxID=706981 RepID=A0A6A5SH25_9PLEO|nr:hypothetical protein EJ02DRAFT_468714 [Clathrospora elynae]
MAKDTRYEKYCGRVLVTAAEFVLTHTPAVDDVYRQDTSRRTKPSSRRTVGDTAPDPIAGRHENNTKLDDSTFHTPPPQHPAPFQHINRNTLASKSLFPRAAGQPTKASTRASARASVSRTLGSRRGRGRGVQYKGPPVPHVLPEKRPSPNRLVEKEDELSGDSSSSSGDQDPDEEVDGSSDEDENTIWFLCRDCDQQPHNTRRRN